MTPDEANKESTTVGTGSKDVPQLDGQYDEIPDSHQCEHGVLASNALLDDLRMKMDDFTMGEDPELCGIFADGALQEDVPLSQYRLWQCDGAGDETPDKGKF